MEPDDIRERAPRFCCIGGGTGLFSVLSGLKTYCPRAEVAAVVSMMDSGGSTGRLRVELGTLPPGDVRKCLIALSDAPHDLLQLMGYRFDAGNGIQGHSLGNLVLTAAKSLAGGEYEAIQLLERILLVRGHVYPVTLDDCHLVAQLADGGEIEGEAAIDTREDGARRPIQGVSLRPGAILFDRAREALAQADTVVIGPGDLYTSLMPNLLVSGLVEALIAARRRGARLVYIVNTMTKRAETAGYSASRFAEVIRRAIAPADLDAVLVNDGAIPEELADAYALEGAEPVVNDLQGCGVLVHSADMVSRRAFARHDPQRLCAALLSVIRQLDEATHETSVPLPKSR